MDDALWMILLPSLVLAMGSASRCELAKRRIPGRSSWISFLPLDSSSRDPVLALDDNVKLQGRRD
jgi:hypothetical protein